MTIEVGQKIPDVTVQTYAEGPAALNTGEFFAGKRVLLFAVPGAFTPTCSAKHLPGYVEHAVALKAKGIDAIVCMAVNDAFVMHAWGESQSVSADITLLADGNGLFAKALGLELDANGFGMGLRSKRFALVANDGVVEMLAVEAPGEFRVSSAEAVLAAL